MNDEFLYQLRKQPPRHFAERLKARLDSQAIHDENQLRRHRWLTLIVAFLAGGVAFALVTPAARDTVRAWIAAPEVVPTQTTSPPAPAQRLASRIAAAEHSVGSTGAVDVATGEQASPSTVHMQTPFVGGAHAPAATSAVAAKDAPPTIIGVQGAVSSAGALSVAHDVFADGLQRSLAEEVRKATPGIGISAAILTDESLSCSAGGRAFDVVLTTTRITARDSKRCWRLRTDYEEIVLAYDAVAVVVGHDNTWTATITLSELRGIVAKRAYQPLQTWNEVRPDWPALTFISIGPVNKSRAMDVLRDVLNESEPTVGVVSVIESDIANQVERTFGSLGFVSFRAIPTTYPARNLVAIVDEQGRATHPTKALIGAGHYPLARAVYGYVNRDSRRLQMAQRFLGKSLTNSELLVAAGFVPLSEDKRREALRTLTNLP